MSVAIAQAAEVTLGGVGFEATSDQVANEWYEPMSQGVTVTFEGFGTKAGHTRSITFTSGGELDGVKTIKKHLVEKAGTEVTEDTWIAFDDQDNARVIKLERAGRVIFNASASTAPPLYLPAVPTEGQSWDLAGTTVTLEQVMPSRSGYRLKVKTVSAVGLVETHYIHAGEGLLLTQVGDDSGWKVKPPESAAPAQLPLPAPSN